MTEKKRYPSKTIYLNSENVKKLEELVQYIGLNSSQIFDRILPMINKEYLEIKEEKFKKLSKSYCDKSINKQYRDKNIHMEELMDSIIGATPIGSVKAVREVRNGDY